MHTFRRTQNGDFYDIGQWVGGADGFVRLGIMAVDLTTAIQLVNVLNGGSIADFPPRPKLFEDDIDGADKETRGDPRETPRAGVVRQAREGAAGGAAGGQADGQDVPVDGT